MLSCTCKNSLKFNFSASEHLITLFVGFNANCQILNNPDIVFHRFNRK